MPTIGPLAAPATGAMTAAPATRAAPGNRNLPVAGGTTVTVPVGGTPAAKAGGMGTTRATRTVRGATRATRTVRGATRTMGARDPARPMTEAGCPACRRQEAEAVTAEAAAVPARRRSAVLASTHR